MTCSHSRLMHFLGFHKAALVVVNPVYPGASAQLPCGFEHSCVRNEWSGAMSDVRFVG